MKSVATAAEPSRIQPRNRGLLATGLFGFFFPLSFVILLPNALITVVLYRLGAYSRKPREYGRDATLSWEKLTSLVVIPVVGLVATFGTGLGFYLLTDQQGRHTYFALLTLILTAEVSVELVILAVHDLFAHHKRTDVLPFEADVIPQDGIDKLVELRAMPGSGFLPGIWRAALCQANNDLLRSTEENETSALPALLTAIRSDRRWQSRFVLLSAAVWLVAGIVCTVTFHRLDRGLGLLLLGMIILATVNLLLSLTISAIQLRTSYHRYLRQGRRIQVLEVRRDKAEEEAADRSRRAMSTGPTEPMPSVRVNLLPHAIWATAAVTAVRIWRTERKS